MTHTGPLKISEKWGPDPEAVTGVTVHDASPQEDEPVTPVGPVAETDIASGQSLVAERIVSTLPGRFMFVPGVGWYTFDGQRWDDSSGLAEKQAEQAVVTTARTMISAAATISDSSERQAELKLAHRTLSSDGQLRGVIAYLSRHPDVLTGINALNSDPLLLNVRNGTLDLRTGDLRPHDYRDRLTKIAGANYTPDAIGKRWEQFLSEALGDPGLADALRRLLGGPGLMGKVMEHVLPVIYGPGGSGKGTFINAIAETYGDYAIAAEPDLVMKRAGAHPTGEMDLLGTRLAFVSESDEGRQLAAATMKRLTGGDKIRARMMRQDFVQFDASHLLVLITNHLPVMPTGDDPAIWRRVRVVPFDRPPKKVDKRLPEHLAAEADAILAWLVTGFTEYWNNGHEVSWPESVLSATSDYRGSSDLLAQFLDDLSVTVDPSAAAEPMGAVYKRWRAWLTDNAPDTRPGRMQDLVRGLRERGEIVRAGTSRNKGSALAGRMFMETTEQSVGAQW